jgi:hypothetical protein
MNKLKSRGLIAEEGVWRNVEGGRGRVEEALARSLVWVDPHGCGLGTR